MSGIFLLGFSILVLNKNDRWHCKQLVLKKGTNILFSPFSQYCYKESKSNIWSGSLRWSLHWRLRSILVYLIYFSLMHVEEWGQEIEPFLNTYCFRRRLSWLFKTKIENLCINTPDTLHTTPPLQEFFI